MYRFNIDIFLVVSLRNSILIWHRKLKTILSKYNIFASFPPVTDETIHRNQLIATRLFIVVFLSSLISITIFNLLIPIPIRMPVNTPTFQEYLDLHAQYNETLECPCSHISVNYADFIYLNASLHQICSSVYVSSNWSRLIFSSIDSRYMKNPYDFRWTAPHMFQLLASFCQLAKENIENGFLLFSSQQIISNSVIEFKVFAEKIDSAARLYSVNVERYL